MDILESIRKFIVKLQGYPEKKKIIILWTVVAVLGLIMGIFWIRGVGDNFSKIGESIKEIEIPKIDISMPEVDLQKIKDQFNQMGASVDDSWKTYENKKYYYSFKFPETADIQDKLWGFGPDGDKEFNQSRVSVTYIVAPETGYALDPEFDSLIIDAIDPKLIPLWNQTDEVKKIYALPLEEFFNSYRDYIIKNKAFTAGEDFIVGNITETSIAGQKAYQFTVTRFGQNENLIVFSNPENNYNIIIGFSDGNKIAPGILSTFKFIPAD